MNENGQTEWITRATAAAIMGVSDSERNGGKFASKYHLHNVIKGPKNSKGYTWLFDASEARDMGLKLAEAAKITASVPREHFDWKPLPQTFVASSSVLAALQDINQKLGHLVSLWENPKDKQF